MKNEIETCVWRSPLPDLEQSCDENIRSVISQKETFRENLFYFCENLTKINSFGLLRNLNFWQNYIFAKNILLTTLLLA